MVKLKNEIEEEKKNLKDNFALSLLSSMTKTHSILVNAKKILRVKKVQDTRRETKSQSYKK